jgi:hypothetical protein
MITAPAARSRSATNESRAWRTPTSASDHAIRGVDVVFDQHRDAVKRSARALGFPLGVERVRDGQRVGVDLHDRAQRGPLLVQLRDAREIGLDELMRGERAGGHARLELRDGHFLVAEVLGARGRRAAGRRSAREENRQGQGSERNYAVHDLGMVTENAPLTFDGPGGFLEAP